MLRNRVKFRHLQEFLGHVNPGSTQIYTRVEVSDLREAHQACHPRGVLRTLSFAEQIQAYLEAVSGRYSESSLNVHRSGLQKFESFAQEKKWILSKQVSRSVLQAFPFLAGLVGELSEATVVMRVRSVKLFLKWACCEGLVMYDAEDYELKSPQYKSPEPPTVEVLKRLLGLPNTRIPEGLRDQWLWSCSTILGFDVEKCVVFRLGT